MCATVYNNAMRCDPNMYGPVLSRQLSMGRMDRALKRRHVERPSVAETESHSLCPQPTGQTGEYKSPAPLTGRPRLDHP
eukprot:gene13957-biopygen12602